MSVIVVLVLLALPKTAMMVITVPMILAIRKQEVASTPTITILATMVMLVQCTIFAEKEIVLLVVPRTVMMVITVLMILVIVTLASVRIIITVIPARMVMLAPLRIFVTTDIVHPVNLNLVTITTCVPMILVT